MELSREQAHKLVDQLFDAKEPEITFTATTATEAAGKPKRTDGKRAVRTKSTGDNVYLLYEEEGVKKKAWVTSPSALDKLGFSMSDVEELEDKDLLEYRMSPSIR